jgi:UDP-N-acetylglucosamine--N-acetylmuramyl-(pentapeptide) pyrophosphoryl-undecaprenol N-acetylglucosamine transferase
VKKILITTGGTGGHVIPAKIIKEHLKNNFEIFYSSDIRGLKYFSSETNKIFIIDTPSLTLSLYFPFRLVKLIYLIFKVIFFLKKKKIEKVISIGGYMSFPVIIAAKILGTTILLVEPNLVLGRGNKFFLNFSKKIICYSNKLSNFPKRHIHKMELIKPLVSKVFYGLEKNENLDKKFCFLIFGGSQGAQVFDELIKETIFDISKNFSIKVFQQTRKDNIQKLKDFYDSKNIENKIFSFENKFHDLINKSDFCITRAGASSLAEITFLKKPFLAIPLPTAKDNHQMKNAQFYEELGCCWVLEQKNLNKEKLLNILFDILKENSDLKMKKLNLEKLRYENSWSEMNKKLQRIINEN